MENGYLTDEDMIKRAKVFWEDHGTDLIRELMIANVDFSYRSFFDKEDQLIDQDRTGLYYEGILLDHIRYREKDCSRIKSKWLKSSYLLPHELYVIECRGHWSLLPICIATLDKGKHDKQQQNGLSTLPKTPPGCKKGGVFA